MAESWKVKNRRWHANLGMMAAVTLGLIAISCPFIAHKWDGDVDKTLKRIHYGEFLPNHLKWIWIDSQGFFLTFLVASGWLMHKKAVKTASRNAAEDPKAAGSSVTILDLDGTGKGQTLVTKAQARGLRAFLCPADQFGQLKLDQEKWLLVCGTGEALSSEMQKGITDMLAEARPCTMKRVEFALEPVASGALGDAIRAGLEQAGARALNLSATNPAAWTAQVLAQLSARSATPSAAPVEGRKPASDAALAPGPTPMGAPEGI